MNWLYKHDSQLELPYQDNISSLIHEPTFQKAAGNAVFQKARFIVRYGNQAVHGPKPVLTQEAVAVVQELFHVGYWLAHTYAKGAKPPAEVKFDRAKLPTTVPPSKPTLDELQKLETQLRERDEKLSAVLKDTETLDAELARLRAEIAAVKQANAATPDDHDYSEEETRDLFIDLLLKEAGWPLDQKRDREYPVAGMPNKHGKGKIDYVLWGDDGLPLAVVEAKRSRKDARVGQQQAKLYADCLQQEFGRRPVIFYTNGYEHWLWDDEMYPPRAVQGFYKRDELELLIQRRTTRLPLRGADVNTSIVDRHYQSRAIRRVCETFEKDHLRRALLVMATGTGKTRTVIGLVDTLMKCNWAKRVLFLADRTALVNQATKAFKAHLPNLPPVNLVTEKQTDGRIYTSTYQTMMGLIDETADGQRRFGSGHFDLVVIDEAHRSVFKKYAAIFEYFDSLLVGLTATPKGEVHKNTYSLFNLETGVPTDTYPLEDAVRDGYLVPPEAVSVPLKFPRQGISKFTDLSADEQEQWDELDWDDDGTIPTQVEAAAVNAWLFNIDTVDKALEHLMTRGLKVAGGDRLGKTIIFAKNDAHAKFIEERFNANYGHLKGHFARAITYNIQYAQTLIDQFSLKENAPHVAISVDMLDTGIDVPEIVNLVFFKMIRSKTKFWQMLGRGTRLCPDLFGPGKHKEKFFVFDFCGNLEFFGANPKETDGSLTEPLNQRLFKTRLELIGTLDEKGAEAGDEQLRGETAERLRQEVGAMNTDNFLVRPKRLYVERYAKPEPWAKLDGDSQHEIARELSGLPSELPTEPEESKRFDLLMLRLQLAVLLSEPSFERLRDQVREIAGLLEEKRAIPMVNRHLELIQDVQSMEWWQDATLAMLEDVRKTFRDLVRFIEKHSQGAITTNFEDEIGQPTSVLLPVFGTPNTDFEAFQRKARAFLRQHTSNAALQKLRGNERLTGNDLDNLERLLRECGGSTGDIDRVKQEPSGLGAFVRSLVGLDREPGKLPFLPHVVGCDCLRPDDQHQPLAGGDRVANLLMERKRSRRHRHAVEPHVEARFCEVTVQAGEERLGRFERLHVIATGIREKHGRIHVTPASAAEGHVTARHTYSPQTSPSSCPSLSMICIGFVVEVPRRICRHKQLKMRCVPSPIAIRAKSKVIIVTFNSMEVYLAVNDARRTAL